MSGEHGEASAELLGPPRTSSEALGSPWQSSEVLGSPMPVELSKWSLCWQGRIHAHMWGPAPGVEGGADEPALPAIGCQLPEHYDLCLEQGIIEK